MKPRVLSIIDTRNVGGPGRGIFQFLEHVQEDDIDFVLCCFQYARSEETEFMQEARRRGVKLRLLREHFRFDPSCLWQAMKILREENCSLLESHGYKSHILAFLLSRLKVLPWVSTSHGWTAEDWKVRFYHFIENFFLRFADHAIAVSPAFEQKLKRLRGEKPTECVFNAVSASEIKGESKGQEIREDCGCTEKTLLLGCFGRLSSEKGQAVLLKGFAEVRDEHPDSRLVFVGDGPDRQKLEQMSEKLGLRDRVFFQGYRQNMRDYFDAIDLLVLPSLSEGLPYVVLEAMSLEVPVISTRVGALDLLIKDSENGWLVPAGDDAALAKKIIQVAGDRDLLQSVGTKGKERLYPEFSPDRRAQKLLAIYQSLGGW